MAYPPPPGLKTSQSTSSSSTPQPHPSLPARPPPPANPAPAFKYGGNSSSSAGASGSRGHGTSDSKPQGGGGYNAFTAFKPRSVGGGSQSWQSQQSAAVSAPSTSSAGYSATQNAYSGGGYQGNHYSSQQSQYYGNQQQNDAYAQQPAAPQIQNPFPLPGQERARGGDSNYDTELEAQIAQWQSAYMNKEESTGGKNNNGKPMGAASAGGANAIPLGRVNTSTPISNSEMSSAANPDTGVAAVVAGADGKQQTVVRSGGGKTWQDVSLLEWDPAHFRLFVGNLAGEVTDESLLKAFSRYSSVQKARVVRDKRTTKSQGYGFVSFSNGDDYFQAAKEMQGKYIGSHPVRISRSTTQIRPTNPTDRKRNMKGGKGDNESKQGANTGAGISKKQAKTKGGLRILG